MAESKQSYNEEYWRKTVKFLQEQTKTQPELAHPGRYAAAMEGRLGGARGNRGPIRRKNAIAAKQLMALHLETLRAAIPLGKQRSSGYLRMAINKPTSLVIGIAPSRFIDSFRRASSLDKRLSVRFSRPPGVVRI